MPLNKPDILQHNNPLNAIVDSNFTRGGIRSAVNTLTELYQIGSGANDKIDQLKQHSTRVYVSGEGNFYLLKDISNRTNFSGWIAENYLYSSGDQTIFGIKTFASDIQVSGTGIFNGLNLNNISGLSLSGVYITITSGNVVLTNPVSAPNLVYNTGDQTISGGKTFDTGITAPNLVYNTGDQTISGTKTFFEGGDYETRIAGGNISFHVNDNGDAGVSIGYGGIDSNEALGLVADNDITLKSRTEYPINFGTNDIQRATITSDGNFGIGTDTPSELLEVVGNIKAASGVYASNLVYNTGDQTISGVKTFTQTASFGTLQINNKKLSSYSLNSNNFIFDNNYLNFANSSSNITGALPNNIISGTNYYAKNLNNGILLITGSGGRTIDGFTTLNLYKNESVQLVGVNSAGYIGWVTISADGGIS
jgi:hypothetical protein